MLIPAVSTPTTALTITPDRGRVLTPVHEEAEWKVLNSALLRIGIELERRKQRQEKFDRLFPELPASPANQTDQTGGTA